MDIAVIDCVRIPVLGTPVSPLVEKAMNLILSPHTNNVILLTSSSHLSSRRAESAVMEWNTMRRKALLCHNIMPCERVVHYYESSTGRVVKC